MRYRLRIGLLIGIFLLSMTIMGQISCQPDTDGDSITDAEDNCPEVYNPIQSNADGDELGDACDTLKSCKEILTLREDVEPAPESGIYPIDPDGDEGALLPFDTFCDMLTDGGGWTYAGQQMSNATTTLGIALWGLPSESTFSVDLLGVSYQEIMVFNLTNGASFIQGYPEATWQDYSVNFFIGTAGNAFKQGTYGGNTIHVCVGYSYNGGTYNQFACDSDSQKSAKGHFAGYAGEYCSGGRLDGTWAWTDGNTCTLRGQSYVYGFAIR